MHATNHDFPKKIIVCFFIIIIILYLFFFIMLDIREVLFHIFSRGHRNAFSSHIKICTYNIYSDFTMRALCTVVRMLTYSI